MKIWIASLLLSAVDPEWLFPDGLDEILPQVWLASGASKT
jgi:hypothetical protein